MRPELKTELWFGMVESQWPIRAFENEVHATTWAGETTTGFAGVRLRHFIWKARLVDVVPLEYVPPGAARLTTEEA